MKSKLETLFDFQMRAAKIEPGIAEYRFHEKRLWRFDYAWPEQRLALEIEGAVWTNGRHNRGKGFTDDCEKYSEAAILGWRIIRATGNQVEAGTALKWVERALDGQRKEADRIPALLSMRSSGLGRIPRRTDGIKNE